MNHIDTALNKLVHDLGIDKLPPEVQEEKLAEIYETLQMRVGARLLEVLNEEQTAEVEAALDKGDEAVQAALHKVVPNYDELVADELAGMYVNLKTIYAPAS